MENEMIKIFPQKMVDLIKNYVSVKNLQEIRVRIDKPVIFTTDKSEIVTRYISSREDLKFILQRISNYSLYAYEEEIKQGFITIKGGHRVGLAGECVMENGHLKTIRNVSSLNIRISREVLGCSNKVMKYIKEGNRVFNTIIISPPKCGKTTMLRDISRSLSESGKKIAVIDERSEIGASYMGVPQMDIGIRSDILDNCLKSEGMILAIRSLSPEVIICDEIGTLKDIESLLMAFNSGVNIITTIHGNSIDDLLKRSVFDELFINNILERVIVLSNKNGIGTIENIYSIPKGGDKKCLKLY